MSAPGVRRRRATRAVSELTTWVLSAAVAGCVALVAVALVAGEVPAGRREVGLTLVAAASGAAAWPIARRWLSDTAVRLRRGASADADEVVRQLAGRGGQGLEEDDLLAELASALVGSTGAESVAIWRAGPEGLARTISVPATPSDRSFVELGPDAARALRTSGVLGRAGLELWLPSVVSEPLGDVRGVPVTHGDTVLGLVVLTRHPGAPRFAPADDALLAEMGGQLGVVLHNRELDAALQVTLSDLRRTNAELRASRQRLVASADAERRRIERDLHDGAQQHLVALAVSLRLAEDALAHEPERIHELLGGLSAELKEAMAELRTLAHGIYPPLLKDSGLVEAMRVAVGRSAVDVTTSHHGIGRYGSQIEAAVYFCCLEALQNVAKHAPGASAHIDLIEDGTVLRAVVDDDGPGLDPDAVRPGHGLGNMADRLGAVGGELLVGRADSGGARVVITVPIDRTAETDVEPT